MMRTKVFYFFITSFILTGSCTKTHYVKDIFIPESKEITISIQDAALKTQDTVFRYSIYNATTNTYFLGGDFLEGLNNYNFRHLIYTIQIFDSKDSLQHNNTSSSISNSSYNEKEWRKYLAQKREDSLTFAKYRKMGIKQDESWMLSRKLLLSNSKLIPKNSNVPVIAPMRVTEETRYDGEFWYDFEKDKDYYMRIMYQCDSNEVKKYLLPREIDSLRKNNIKIFHGTVYSNKVPLIVE